MPITESKVRLMGCKHELDWLCKCITSTQLVWLIRNFGGLPDGTIVDYYDIACCMSKMTAKHEGGEVTPATTSACVKQLLDAVCSPDGRTGMKVASAAASVILAMPGLGDFPITKTVATLLKIAIGVIEVACEKQEMTASAAKIVCASTDALDKLVKAGGAIPQLAGPIIAFYELAGVKKAIASCCSDPGLQNVPLPDWWKL